MLLGMEYLQHSVPPARQALCQARLRHLFPGLKMWMKDPRQTPVEVIGLEDETATMRVRVIAFEDSGAEWAFAYWEVSKFRVARETVQHECPERLEAAAARFRRRLRLKARPKQRRETELEIVRLQAEVPLRALGPLVLEDLLKPEGEAAMECCLEVWLKRFGLWQKDLDFARAYHSNPYAGELVKGHRIALARLGLVSYDGAALREAAAFEGFWSFERRAEHIMARQAFARAVWAHLGFANLPLWRALAGRVRNSGYVSASFDKGVAQAVGEGEASRQVLYADVPLTRVFMTHLETPGLRTRYQEAEAVLFFDPSARF